MTAGFHAVFPGKLWFYVTAGPKGGADWLHFCRAPAESKKVAHQQVPPHPGGQRRSFPSFYGYNVHFSQALFSKSRLRGGHATHQLSGQTVFQHFGGESLHPSMKSLHANQKSFSNSQ